jgi:hypothetical protein
MHHAFTNSFRLITHQKNWLFNSVFKHKLRKVYKISESQELNKIKNLTKIQEASATLGSKLLKNTLPGDLKFSFFLGLLFNFIVISLI